MLLLLLFPLSSLAATLEVCSNGCAFQDIGSALDAASQGDTVLVGRGTWEQLDPLLLVEDLEIIGAGSESTTLRCFADCFLVSSAAVTISGFTLEPGADAHAIRAQDSEVELDDLSLTDIMSVNGGIGLLATESTLWIANSHFEALDAGEAFGAALELYDSELILTDTVLRDCQSLLGGAIYAESSRLILERVEGRENIVVRSGPNFSDGSFMALYGSSVWLTDVVVADNGTDWTGINGAIWQMSIPGQATVEFSDTRGLYTGNASSYGGALFLRDTTVHLDASSFDGNTAQTYGGGIVLLNVPVAVLKGVRFAANASPEGSAFRTHGHSGTLSLEGCEVSDHSVGGGIIVRDAESLRVADSFFSRTGFPIGVQKVGTVQLVGNRFFESNTLEGAPNTVEIFDYVDAEVKGNLWCDSAGGLNAGLSMSTLGDESASTIIRSNIFLRSLGGSTGAITVGSLGPVEIAHNHVLGSHAGLRGSALHFSGAPDGSSNIRIANNIIAYNTGEPAMTSEHDARSARIQNNLFWGNEEGDLGPNLPAKGADDIHSDPNLGWVLATSCEDFVLKPACDGPTVDAGHTDYSDPDGSLADLGFFGGPDAPEWPHIDADGDGYRGACDCDDTQAQIHPGARDKPGDGIDQDCDGEDAQGGCGCAGPFAPGSWDLVLLGLIVGLGYRRRGR